MAAAFAVPRIDDLSSFSSGGASFGSAAVAEFMLEVGASSSSSDFLRGGVLEGEGGWAFISVEVEIDAAVAAMVEGRSGEFSNSRISETRMVSDPHLSMGPCPLQYCLLPSGFMDLFRRCLKNTIDVESSLGAMLSSFKIGND